MFERFLHAFKVLPPEQAPNTAWREPRLLGLNGYGALAEKFAGCSFENGLYRLHDATSGPQALTWIADAFPEFAGRVCPFGYDWLGRQFAVDAARLKEGQPLVLLLEPGTGEALEIPATIVAFHNEELVEARDAALASEFFDDWARTQPHALPLAPQTCVGYRVPLFLGGSDTLENLEVTDLDVYWTICGQLRLAAAQLPEGTAIKGISGIPDGLSAD